MIKSEFISDILELLLDSDDGRIFQKQLPGLTDIEYNYTGSGVFVTFAHNGSTELEQRQSENLILDGLEIKSGAILADAIVFVKNGLLDYLEIWRKDGEYPRHDLSNYILTQRWTSSTGRQIKKTNA